MKKIIIMVLAITVIAVNAMAADTVLSYTIPEAKVAEYISDYVYVHENTETTVEANPAYVDEETTLGVSPTIHVASYTNAQWVREHILRTIRGQIIRGKNLKYRDAQASNNANDVN